MTIQLVIWDSLMESYSVAEAKAHLSELLDRVEAGEEVSITRRGKVVARVVADKAKKKRQGGLPSMADLRATMPISPVSTEDFIRQLRDDARY